MIPKPLYNSLVRLHLQVYPAPLTASQSTFVFNRVIQPIITDMNSNYNAKRLASERMYYSPVYYKTHFNVQHQKFGRDISLILDINGVENFDSLVKYKKRPELSPTLKDERINELYIQFNRIKGILKPHLLDNIPTSFPIKAKDEESPEINVTDATAERPYWLANDQATMDMELVADLSRMSLFILKDVTVGKNIFLNMYNADAFHNNDESGLLEGKTSEVMLMGFNGFK
ncbi:Hypothetical protein PP7435_CHR4-0640 [Komagataella phaffii CBS 7435]|uniref:Uncharacterized protein n=1 Tax=Komagataella phaffii (strain ATCC 76273 / CBS 7435 / CECT 11047 / NRRL Y-11430 / Wegner 21-1) TaxID=981350 RepID=F2QZH0_KOMPC|nr:GQ67_04694T0 [Komagataella phaffii]AOA69768.1 GQ68_04666T0 [Komagataella phaffii GS115]CAH2451025.1 Hypothetical protein BQ9382_C4-3365 [Komagataella phaffii CBS 7435]CCA40798.1 Hypothetical protein PP7435_CHR4-0640 [Komagataella phaffii CBS 7435]